MKQSREWIAGAVLATAGAVFALVMLEGGVRLLHLVPDRFWESDPVLGARLVPAASGWWSQEEREFLVPIQINQKGLRDIEHEYEKKAGVFRVLVLGDSFVEAMQVQLADTFARRLQVEFEKESKPVEVINAGVSGYGTAGAVLFFEQEGVRYQPDVVMLMFYPGNDVRNNSPVFEDDLKPVYGEDGGLQRIEKVGSASTRETGWRSKAYQYLRKLVLTRQPALAKALADLGLLRPGALRAPMLERDGMPVEYGVYSDPPAGDWQDAWRRTESLLARLHAGTRKIGADLLIAVVTTRERIYPDTWKEILATYPAMQQRGWDLEAPRRRLASWCAASGARCLDLEAAFEAKRDSGGDVLHFRYDGHWTPAGHAVAASALKTFIEGQGLLPAKSGGSKHENR